jgi:hypothetical protein
MLQNGPVLLMPVRWLLMQPRRRACSFTILHPGITAVDDRTKVEMNIRNSICEKWNSELIWGLTIKR